MAGRILTPLPLTAERFAPYGDVIAAGGGERGAMNAARFERWDDLAGIDVDPRDGGHVALSVARCRTPTRLPYRVDMIERHPLGSQAFVPLGGFRTSRGRGGKLRVIANIKKPAVLERILGQLGHTAEPVDPAHPSGASPPGDHWV